jgi:hypothetical protein
MIQNRKDRKKIGSMIAELHDVLNFIYDSHNTEMYHSLWLGVGKDFRKRAYDLNLPQNISNHLQSTVVGILRQKGREYMINRGGLSKKQTDKLKEKYQKHYDEFIEKAEELGCLYPTT